MGGREGGVIERDRETHGQTDMRRSKEKNLKEYVTIRDQTKKGEKETRDRVGETG